MEKCEFYNGTETVTPSSTRIKCSKMDGGGRVFENKDPEGKMIASCCWSGGKECPLLVEDTSAGMEQSVLDGCENSVVAAVPNGDISSERQERAIKLTRQIVANGNIAASCMVDMGRDLKSVRDERLFTELGFDSFEEYCEKKCGIGKRHGYNFIQVYERFGEEQLSQLQGLGITKLLEMAKLDDNDLGELMNSSDVSEMSVRELKDKIAEYDKTCEQLQLELDSAESDKQEANEKNMHLKFERDEIKIQLQQAEEQRARLEQKVSTLEKENQEKSKQLQETVNDACDTREKLNKQITELTARYHKEKEKLNSKIKELEERPATASKVSEEQIAAIRAEVEKSATEKAEKEREAAVKAAQKKADESRLIAVEAARKQEQEKYSAELEKLRAENAALQSNAQKADPSPSSDDKDKIRFYIGEVQRAFNAAVEVINSMSAEEQQSFKGKMKTAIERMVTALD